MRKRYHRNVGNADLEKVDRGDPGCCPSAYSNVILRERMPLTIRLVILDPSGNIQEIGGGVFPGIRDFGGSLYADPVVSRIVEQCGAVSTVMTLVTVLPVMIRVVVIVMGGQHRQ